MMLGLGSTLAAGPGRGGGGASARDARSVVRLGASRAMKRTAKQGIAKHCTAKHGNSAQGSATQWQSKARPLGDAIESDFYGTLPISGVARQYLSCSRSMAEQ